MRLVRNALDAVLIPAIFYRDAVSRWPNPSSFSCGLPSIWSTGEGAPLSFGSPLGSSAESAASALPPIVARWGFDLSPLNVDRPEDARWLEACVWPGEHERLTRLSCALSAFRALARSESPPRL